MDEHRTAECGTNRQTKRSLVLLAARIRASDRTFDVRLRNLSQNGALLEGSVALPIGTEVTFERGNTNVRARIAWTSQSRFGITFLVPIEESEVLIHVGRPHSKPSAQPAPSFKRAALTGATLSAGERRIAEEWTRAQGRSLGD